MPTPIPKHRTYCKTCNDFKIHSWAEENLICDSCKTVFSSYFPAQIDQKLIQEQRDRYNQYKINNVNKMLTGIVTFSSSDQSSLIECDAGQKEIDEKRKEKLEEIKKEYQLVLEDYNNNYKHLNRNDKCNCNSNKKFKQCHLIIFHEKGLKI